MYDAASRSVIRVSVPHHTAPGTSLKSHCACCVPAVGNSIPDSGNSIPAAGSVPWLLTVASDCAAAG
jgi:hypothetical protein